VKDYEKAPKLIFSIPLHAIQSITYQTKMWGNDLIAASGSSTK